MDEYRRKFLTDVLGSIDEITQFTLDIESLQAYEANRLVQRAVERNIEIIGEAVKRVTEGESPLKIENARQIIATRNRIIHGYDSVDNAVVWSIVRKHLPLLRGEVEHLLNLP
jgi:uncharacterized protein with HEPN domain